MTIETKDRHGNPNGTLTTIWNATETDYRPDQVYVTTVNPGMTKGPHLHLKRTGYFKCISGNCDMIVRNEQGVYRRVENLGLTGHTIQVGPGVAMEIVWTGVLAAYPSEDDHEPAVLINCPSPAWTREDPDDHPVENWEPNV